MPRLGLFWSLSPTGAPFRLATFLRPFDAVPEVNGLKSVVERHEDIWPQVQRLDPSLAPHAFDHFPQGRLDYFSPGRRWLLSLDPELNCASVVNFLVQLWKLDDGHLTVTSDRA
jgi:hypothetical protein